MRFTAETQGRGEGSVFHSFASAGPRVSAVFLVAAIIAVPAMAAEVPKAPVPVSPFVRVVYGYADAMLKSGRDTNGLFFSALDRNTLTPLTNRPAAPDGVRTDYRVGTPNGPLTGSNPYHDENLLRLLSTLSDLSAKPHYRAAADAELEWFVGHGQQEDFRPWLLWDRCFALAPEASRRLALLTTNSTLPRETGFRIRTWAAAYAQTRDERFTGAITDSLRHLGMGAPWRFTPSVAIDCEGAAHRVPEPLAARLRAVAAEWDERFCVQPHDVKRTRGFLANSVPARGSLSPLHTPLWKAAHDVRTTAEVGMMCVSRYDNTGRIAYRDLILAAADAYLDSLAAPEVDAWPGTFGHAISLQLAAWRHSADWKYMERARQLGDIAVEKFWGTKALPRASLKSEHYESITGADTLALSLLELHLQILHITAVRCPSNTMDR